MTYEFKCDAGHINTRTFSTIGKAVTHFEDKSNPDDYDSVQCSLCEGSKPAARIYGNSGTVFYGEGWDKPAPSGKTATRGVDPTKAIPSLGPPRDKGFMGRPGVR